VKTALILGGAAVVAYWLYQRGSLAALGLAPTTDAGAQGVNMTAGGQAATVYGPGTATGQTIRLPAGGYPARVPYPMTAPTPVNPFVGALKAAVAAAAPTPVAIAPNLNPNRLLVPTVRGTVAATAIS
jgi:hypothetical protein